MESAPVARPRSAAAPSLVAAAGRFARAAWMARVNRELRKVGLTLLDLSEAETGALDAAYERGYSPVDGLAEALAASK